ncbi:hypothetical protein EHS25_009782 [Saitozyma podzolica]|uniref:Uncharacterized protein n=1 Tax=Saitozyma podzolica TaxID=1890683 RepID=A0A427YK58_9TREE|nr:hypothetical protein EHS25_009782 [Saitozyma podzolica]
MSYTPSDPHFIQNPDLDILSHRPHKSLKLLFQAFLATAVFRIWPTLLFMGGWSAGVVLVNLKTPVTLAVPNTMLTVLGVLLGLTLSYRTSSAYDRYWEGRRLWSQIILASRTWARVVWIHCPDSLLATPPTDPEAKARDETRAIIEKSTMVRMALAFAVAVKHYLRGEEGIFYEDLYHLVRFIPSLDFPSGIPSPAEANIGSDPTIRRVHRQDSVSSSSPSSDDFKSTFLPPGVALHPANDPPKFRWSDTFPTRFFVTRRYREKKAGRKLMRAKMRETREGGGVGRDVPLEVNMFMSAWIAAIQKRKTVDVSTVNSLLAAIQSMADALVGLERILTTPIPWSYSAHIWEVTYVYCLTLPFQLYGSGFGWVTVPATVITAYIVVGFAAIGAEIENPFGYDRNDLNLDHYTSGIIARELDAIIARPFAAPEEWVFSDKNMTFGPVSLPGPGVAAGMWMGLNARELEVAGTDVLRKSLAGRLGSITGSTGSGSPKGSTKRSQPKGLDASTMRKTGEIDDAVPSGALSRLDGSRTCE